MRCPEREVWLTVATGERGRSDRLLRHAETCSECRREFEAAREAVRVGFPALARGVGWSPAEAGTRTREILAAVRAGERPEGRMRPAPAPAPVRRFRRRLALGVAVGVVAMLILFTARFLGESSWTGRLEIARGALLLAEGDAPLGAADAAGEIGPGRVLVVPPESEATLRSPELGTMVLRGPAVVATGSGGDRPALFVARGTVFVRSAADGDLRIDAGDHVMVARGGAEIAVRSAPGIEPLRWARSRAATARKRGLLGFASAFAADAAPLAVVDVHCLAGEVKLPGAPRPLTRGEETTLGGDVAIRWSGEQEIYPSGRFGLLTPAETERMEELLAGKDDAVGALLLAAGDPDRPASDRALAIWLLSEIGEGAREIPALVRVFRDAETPPSVKAAAVRTLGVLGDRDMVVSVKVLRDDVGRSPVVAEALVQALGRTGDPKVRGELVRYFGETDRPTFARILAAAAAAAGDERLSVSAESLVALTRDPEGPSALPALAHLLAVTPDPAGRPALLELARAAGPARPYAFDELARLSEPGAEDAAEAVLLAPSASPALDLTAMKYLQTLDRPRARDQALRLLAAPDRTRDLAALRALSFVSSGEDELPEWVVARLRALVADPTAPEALVLPAIRALGSRNDVERLLDLVESASARVRHQAIEELAIGFGAEDLRLTKADRYEAALVECLEFPAEHVRFLAWRNFAAFSPERALALARTWLATAPPSIRMDCLAGLVRLTQTRGGGDSESLTDLADRILTESPSPMVRERAICVLESLARDRTPGASDRLVSWLQQHREPSEARNRALSAVARHGDPEVIAKTVISALSEPGVGAATTALGLLKRIRTEETTRLGARVLADASTPLARLVGAVLVGEADTVTNLLREGDSVVWDVALLSLPPEQLVAAEDALAEHLTTGDRAQRILAAFILAAGHAEPSKLEPLTGDRDPLVRFAVISGRVGSPGAPQEAELQAAMAEAIRTRETGPTWTWNPRDSVTVYRLRIESFLPVRRFVESLQGFQEPASSPWMTAEEVRTARLDGARARQSLLSDRSTEWFGAIETLGWIGDRGDVAAILEQLSPEHRENSLAARLAVPRLLGRTYDGERTGREMAHWWTQRAFALDVPIVRRRD